MHHDGTDSERARFGPWRREVRAFLELLALCGVAVAQPTFDILDNNAVIFVTRGTTPVEIMGLAAIVVLGPALGLWLVEVLLGVLAPRSRRWVHAIIAAGIVGLIAVAVLKKATELGPWALVILAIPVAGLGGWLLLRFRVVGLWLRYLAVAPLLFAVVFVFFSPVTTVVFGKDPSSADATVARPKRVVMIVLDELPTASLLDGTGKVDAALFPNFAALAQQSTWYRNATTVAPLTGFAVPAIVSGLYPTESTSLGGVETRRNLFTLLGRTHEMNVHEAVTRLCPASLCGLDRRSAAGVHPGLRGLVYDSFVLWRGFASPRRTPEEVGFAGNELLGDFHAMRSGGQFVRSLRPAAEPRLDFLHLLLPHAPSHYLPSGQDYLEREMAGGLNDDSAWQSEWAARLARQRHLLQLVATDRLLGRVVAKLERIGAYDDALLIVTADHGVAFTAGEVVRGVSEENAPQVAWSPLFVKTPGETRSVVDDRPASTIDIVPTVADHLDVELPWRVDGRSLLGRPAPDGPRPMFHWRSNSLPSFPGRKEYDMVPGPTNFARMLRSRASDATGDPALRLYKIGTHADLLGRPVGQYVRTRSPGTTGSLDDPSRFRSVNPTAPQAPWAYVAGSIDGVRRDAPLAIALNGTIAGFSATVGYTDAIQTMPFWSVLPPQMFRQGRNDVAVYLIRGDAAAPELEPVRLEP
jgi:hypothetical protein